MNDLDDLGSRVSDYNRRRLAWKWSPATPLEPLNAEAFIIIEDMVRLYAQSNESQRAAIRNMAARSGAVYGYLDMFVCDRAKRLQQHGNTVALVEALLAASIYDNGGDYRDNYVDLGDLYTSAVKAGINPTPYFMNVAALSSRSKRNDVESTHDMLAHFEQSAYFLEDVQPKLNKPC